RRQFGVHGPAHRACDGSGLEHSPPKWTPVRRRNALNSTVLSGIAPQARLAFCLEVFSATAARTSAIKASSSTFSPLRISMARRVEPSRLDLNRPDGSSNDAPLAKVSLTTSL